jgi:hypothetical protein
MTNKAVTQATNEILEAFRAGRLAEPLAQTFLPSGLHCERWTSKAMAAAVKHILDEAEALRLAQISMLELCPPG